MNFLNKEMSSSSGKQVCQTSLDLTEIGEDFMDKEALH